MATTTILSGKPGRTIQVNEPSADLTVYVRAAGDDADDGFSEANAKLTIQAAVEVLPFTRDKKVTVDVGPGTFAGFYLGDVFDWAVKAPALMSNLTIQGTMAEATITGYSSGTASGGSIDGDGRYVLNKPAGGDNWVPDALIGKQLRTTVAGPSFGYIIDNDATTLTLAAKEDVTKWDAPFDATTVFTIYDHMTDITSGALPATADDFYATMYNLMTHITIKDIVFEPLGAVWPTVMYFWGCQGSITLDRCKFVGLAGGSANIYRSLSVDNCESLAVDECLFLYSGWTDDGGPIATRRTPYVYLTSNTFIGDKFGETIFLQDTAPGSFMIGSYLDGLAGGSWGLVLSGQSTAFRVTESYITDYTTDGIYGLYGKVDLYVAFSVIEDCRYGILLSSTELGLGNTLTIPGEATHLTYPVTIDNCANDAIMLRGCDASVQALTGTGAAGYGIRIGNLARVIVDGNTDITGTTNDFIINATPGTYAGDLASPGDSVVDAGSGAIIIRE